MSEKSFFNMFKKRSAEAVPAAVTQYAEARNMFKEAGFSSEESQIGEILTWWSNISRKATEHDMHLSNDQLNNIVKARLTDKDVPNNLTEKIEAIRSVLSPTDRLIALLSAGIEDGVITASEVEKYTVNIGTVDSRQLLRDADDEVMPRRRKALTEESVASRTTETSSENEP